jgi:phosphinothricin acetyltransferase
MLRPVTLEDAPAIAGIYNYYIAYTAITFEEDPVDARIIEERIRAVTASQQSSAKLIQFPWFVWEEGSEILGYAYAHKWHERAAYRYAVEDSIYLKQGFQRRGIGRALLEKVIAELRRQEIHVVMSVITLPNEGSVGLHESFGFKKAGQFSEIGLKFGKRLDVGYWELILDGAGS